MLWFYNVRKYLLISVLIIIIDGLIIYFIPSYFNKLNYFYPMLTISLIPFIYFTNKKYNYFLITVIGIIYDILYSNIFLFNVILFIIIVNLDILISKYFKNKFFLFLLLTLFNIIIYDLISFILVIITNYQTVTIYDLLYKINHSILLNIMSAFVYYFLFKKDLSKS